MENKKEKIYKEKVLKPMNGWYMILIEFAIIALCIALIVIGAIFAGKNEALSILLPIIGGMVLFFTIVILNIGFKLVRPNAAMVLVLFGKYFGTVKEEGFYWINPFCVQYNPAPTLSPAGIPNRKLSLKAMTLDNQKQKVNDADGNPIEIGVVVIWKICDTAKAVFNVEKYPEFVSIQADATIRNIARQYPYDVPEGEDEKSLRGSSQEISEMLKQELQTRVEIAGIEIVEARISHLAYSQEIAAAMLQRQQAKAVVDARTTIVEGAVGMVELALEKLNAKEIVELDEERKAQMVSNLMVVLCSNKDAQPIVNSGNIF